MRFSSTSGPRAFSVGFISFSCFFSLIFAQAEVPPFQTQVRAIGELIQAKELAEAQITVEQFWAEHYSEKGFVDAVRRIKDCYWAEGNYADHFALCERIVQAFPNDPLSIGIQVDIVTGYIKQKDLTQVSEKLEQFWNRYHSDDRFVDFARRIKDQYWRDGYYAEHFNLCERLVQAFPDDPLAMSVYTDDITGYIRTKDTQKAAAQLDSFWTQYHSKEGFTSHLRTIRDVYWSNGYIEAHDVLCDRIFQAFPNDPVTFEIIAGRISEQIRVKNTAKASEDLEQFWTAHKADEGFVSAVRHVKDEYWKEGYYAEHFNLCERIVKEFPDDPLSIGIQTDQVTGYIKLKDMIKAAEELEQFWAGYSADDRFVDYARRIKDQYWTSGHYAEHFAVCDRIINAFPDHPLNLAIRADAITGYIHDKDFAAAGTACDQMLARFAEEPMLCAEIYRVAKAYAAGGQTDKAMELHRSNAQQYGGTDYGRWSAVEWILHLIRQKDFAAAETACGEFAARYAEESTLGKELYIIGREFAAAGDRDRGFGQHLYNVEHAKESDHTRWSNVEVVFYYIDKEHYEDAEAACLAFIERYSDHSDLGKELQNMINRYAASGRIAHAEALCNAALQAYPGNHNMIWMQYGLICVYLDQMAQADVDAAFDALLNDNAENPELTGVVKALGHYCREQYNDTGQAIEFYSLFLSQYGDRPDAFEVERERIGIYIDLKAAGQVETAARNFLANYPTLPQRFQMVNGFADRCREMKMYPAAIAIYQMVLAQEPTAEEQVEAYGGLGKAAVYVEEEAEGIPDPQAIVQILMADHPNAGRLGFHVFQIGEAYYYRAKQYLLSENNRTQAEFYYRKAFAVWENNLYEIPDAYHRALAYYMMGQSHRQRKDWLPAAEALLASIEANPDHPYAGTMHWMISECYVRLKAAGAVSAEEADPIIEWGYQTLFDTYPNSRGVEYAAVQLVNFYLVRGRPASAGVYLNWLLDRVQENPAKSAIVYRLVQGWEVCGQ